MIDRAMMPELIDRAEVLKRLCASCSNMGSFACISCVIPHIVKDTPTIEAEPVRNGRWIELPNPCQTNYECFKCGAIGAVKTPYCAYCGARMDGGAEQ